MEEKILEALRQAGKPVRPGEIASAVGADPKEVSKTLAAMKKAGTVISPVRCCYAPA